MAEYVDNGVKVVGVGDQIGFCATHTEETPDIRIGVVFKKSGLYNVSVDNNSIAVLNVTPQSKTCGGCKYDRKPDITCLTCSRKCTDHYEKEVQRYHEKEVQR